MYGKKLFNTGWEFVKTPAGTELEELSQYEKSFAKVDVPHDWLIYDTENLYETSTGWYRKRYQEENLADTCRLLYFDGIYMDSIVYVNGRKAGEWKYGYSAFELAITELLAEGDNEILVQVNYKSPNSRWYSGAGIYRNVWLRTAPKNHIATDGIYVAARKNQDGDIWDVHIKAQLVWQNPNRNKGYILHYALKNGTEVIAQETREAAYGSCVESCTLRVTSPLLWELKNPHRYQLEVRFIESELPVCADGIACQIDWEAEADDLNRQDMLSIVVGFRTTEWIPSEGFFLNGEKIKLHGVCEHHDLGCLGAAFHKPAMRRRFAILQKMGVNAVRTSHNMPAKEFMELTDEMGILVVSEAFDMWETPKTEYDYARFFKEWAERDVASWVRRDRNHPSLIMWSIGNEIYDTHADAHGQDITRRLMNAVLLHDPCQNGVVTIGSNYMPWENAQRCADIVKIAGYNYAERYYDSHHKQYADWVIYGSETSSVVQSRGVYHFPREQAILTDDDEQCSSLGNSTTSWGGKSPEACIIADRDARYSPGQFIWAGHDYIGEPTPYQTKNSYFGQIDTAGFPKDSYYIYQAAWTDYKLAPMVHIFPYWDYNEGQLIDVCACTNAPKVEIFVNGISQGMTEIDHRKGKSLIAHAKVPYERGSIQAVAYDEHKVPVAWAEEHSFGDSARIKVRPDRKWLRADGEDMVFVEISMEDKDGHPVQNASDYVEVTVTGAGRLLGLDNGDSTDYDQYKGTKRKLFNGRLVAAIGARTIPGPIGITVTDIGAEEDIAPKTLTIQAVAADAREGICASEENKAMPLVTGENVKIPVRKIELTSSTRTLNQTTKSVLVKAYIYPPDATDNKVEWHVVNDAGIPTNLADWKEAEAGDMADCVSAVCVTAKGDGSFRVKCTSKNGTDKVKLISQIELRAEQLGEAFLNPYQFIAGGLYNWHKGDVGSYHERGIGTSPEEETCVGYKGIDFGEYGSDEVTIPIFADSEDVFYIDIWEGIPGEKGSLLVGRAEYQKPCLWEVYQPITCKLQKRLKGISTVCFVTNKQRLFLKGFSFTKFEKAFECLPALFCDKLYGDAYTKQADAVEDIGNNVTLEYDNMDFGEQGCHKIAICGRTPLAMNTIYLRFFGQKGDAGRLLEFPHTEEYTEVEFDLEPIAGLQKIAFVFLPGSNFDFKYFKFS